MANLSRRATSVRYSRALGVFAAAALLAGCKTWQVTSMSPQRLVAEQRPRLVRVTTNGGSTVTLMDPMIVEDSIVTGGARPLLPFTPPRVGVAAVDVQTLEVAQFSARRTLGLAAVLATAAVAWATVASQSAGGSLPPGGDVPKDPISGFLGALRIAWRISP
jgi:hypothetical protein